MNPNRVVIVWERVDNETVSNGDIVSLGNQLCYNLNASQGKGCLKLEMFRKP
jgi:hypothetical protein